MKKVFLAAAAAFPLTILVACGGSTTEAEAVEAPAVEANAGTTSTVAPAEAGAALGNVSTGAYGLDKGHGYIMMTYDHQGYSKPYIRFVGFDAQLNLNVDDPAASSVSVSIDPATIDSGVPRFDDHLKSADFFDVENHGGVTFVSTGLTVTGADTGTMIGDLTIKGMTKPVTLDVMFNKADKARDGSDKVGFSARGTVKRSDWELDLYAPFVSDEVELIIETEFVEQ